MQFLSIGINNHIKEIKEGLDREIKFLSDEKVKISIDDTDIDQIQHILCYINEEIKSDGNSKLIYDSLKIHVANVLSDYIIKQYEHKLLLRTINSNYCYFSSAEKRDILNRAISLLSYEDKNIMSNMFQLKRKNIIMKKLLEYFDSSSEIILDGFVNFRLKEYVKHLEELVDKAVDDFLMDREYREFIRLLRYFVDIQEPKIVTVHVLSAYDSKYILLDNKKKEITNECIQDFVNEISVGEINYDDLLVSSLITLAPKNIIIHSIDNFKNLELLETIKNVFIGRVTVCNGCDLCISTSAVEL